jgi:protein-S-isoprenylcysteine O-methyltransferase Ste14
MDAAHDRGHARRTAWLLVGAQFGLLAAIVLTPYGQTWPSSPGLRWAGMALVVLGVAIMGASALRLGRGLTASPLPNARAELHSDGLYRLVRHPIYTGLLAFALGCVLPSGSMLRAVLFVLLLALLTVKSRWEERWLAERFPGYAAYATRTPRFVPALRSVRLR